MKKYLFNIGVSIDQLGNAITGGDPDNTISAKVGYYCYRRTEGKNVPWQWRLFRWIIDRTFYPVDGPEHCRQAYHSDPGENFENNASNITLALIAIIIILSCIVIAAILHFLWLIRLVKPKERNQDRHDQVTKRLEIAQRKLKGVVMELQKAKDSDYTEIIDTVAQANEVVQGAKEKLALVNQS